MFSHGEDSQVGDNNFNWNVSPAVTSVKLVILRQKDFKICTETGEKINLRKFTQVESIVNWRLSQHAPRYRPLSTSTSD